MEDSCSVLHEHQYDCERTTGQLLILTAIFTPIMRIFPYSRSFSNIAERHTDHMNGASEQSFAEDVADRGTSVYQMLHLYDDGDCVNLYHGDGALPPHPTVRDALRKMADNMEVWSETCSDGSSNHAGPEKR